MAVIKAFRALQYDRAAGPMKDLICPVATTPDEEALRRLHAGNPYNIAHLVFPREARDPFEQVRYLAEQWHREGILVRDEAKGLYLHEQCAQWNGSPKRTLQLLGMVRLDDDVFSYCEPPVTADPFHLLCAADANFDAMQALVPDMDGAMLARLRKAAVGTPLTAFEDSGGVSHKVWKIENSTEIGELAELIRAKPLILTGGKRRYDAALRYREHMYRTNPMAGEINWALMSLAPVSSDNVSFLPTQLLLNLPDFDEVSFLEDCGAYCSMERIPTAELSGAVQAAQQMGESAVGVVIKDAAYLLVPRTAEGEELSVGVERVGNLPYHMLDTLILGRVIGLEARNALWFSHNSDDAIAAVREEEASLAFLLAPATPQGVLAFAASGETMPQEAALPYPSMIAGHIMADLNGK